MNLSFQESLVTPHRSRIVMNMKRMFEYVSEQGLLSFFSRLLDNLDRQQISRRSLSDLVSSPLRMMTLISFFINNLDEIVLHFVELAMQKRKLNYPDWIKSHHIPEILMQLSMYEVDMASRATTSSCFFRAHRISSLHTGDRITGTELYRILCDSDSAYPKAGSRIAGCCVGVVALERLREHFVTGYPMGIFEERKVYGFADIIRGEDSEHQGLWVPCLYCSNDENPQYSKIAWERLEEVLHENSFVLYWPDNLR